LRSDTAKTENKWRKRYIAEPSNSVVSSAKRGPPQNKKPAATGFEKDLSDTTALLRLDAARVGVRSLILIAEASERTP
jgi:hypothetical protein